MMEKIVDPYYGSKLPPIDACERSHPHMAPLHLVKRRALIVERLSQHGSPLAIDGVAVDYQSQILSIPTQYSM